MNTTDGAHGVPSWPKLKRVPEGEVRLEPGENGELLAESCSPLVEWERNQSRPSSWLRSCGDGPYLMEIKEKVKADKKTNTCGFCVFTGKVDLFLELIYFFTFREADIFLRCQISSQNLTQDESDHNNSVNID